MALQFMKERALSGQQKACQHLVSRGDGRFQDSEMRRGLITRGSVLQVVIMIVIFIAAASTFMLLASFLLDFRSASLLLVWPPNPLFALTPYAAFICRLIFNMKFSQQLQTRMLTHLPINLCNLLCLTGLLEDTHDLA
jgi:hypothetical protein